VAGSGLSSDDARSGAGPIAYQGHIYVYRGDGSVTAYSAQNGGRVWTAAARPDGVGASTLAGGGVAADGGRVFAASAYRAVVAFDAGSGNRLWLYDLPQPARSAPTAAGGRVYMVSASNVLYALNAADGKELWTYTGVPGVAGLVSSASPAVSGNLVIVPFSSGEVIAFDAAKGTPKWQSNLARFAGQSSLSGLPEVAARPVVSGGVVIATSVSGRIMALKLATGDSIWDRELGSASTPAVAGNGVFLVTVSGDLVALDRGSGKIAWSLTLPSKGRESWAGPTLAGGKLWVASSAGRLISVNAATGEMAGEQPLGNPVYLAPIVAGGRLILLSGDGALMSVA
jgi:outer membrane protein assembly factor BamB